MAVHEHSDFVQSCLRFFNFEDDPILNYGYYGDAMLPNHADDIYNRQSFGVYYDIASNNVDNDEIIAQTLQEEFSRLDMEESSRAGEDHSQAIVHTWQSPPRNYSPGIKKSCNVFFYM